MKEFAFTLAEGATHVAMSENIKKVAFTLAEVLITLGIIGVVAAMTMPTLIQNHQKQVYATRLKKAVSVLENMRNKLMADEEVTNFNDTKLIREGYNWDCVTNPDNEDVCGEDGYSNISIIQTELANAFNIVKTCTNSECDILYQQASLSGNKYEPYGSPVKFEDFGYGGVLENHLIGVYTADGTIFYFYPSADSGGAYLSVYIDVNGEKGPNQEGRDLYLYILRGNEKGWFNDGFGSRMMTNGWKMDY